MKIAFYAPFKPLAHPNPSGDRIIAAGIYTFLENAGHTLETASDFRCRWIFRRPHLWPRLFAERRRVIRKIKGNPPDLWLTYHSYYKAPDMLGPGAARAGHIPYVIFQGIYSTKRKKQLSNRAGFHFNRNALLAADHIFTNKRIDWRNLKRLLPENRITYIGPSLQPAAFCFDATAREQLRRDWRAAEIPVVLSVAMFRPGVKTRGLEWTIRACGRLSAGGHKLKLIIVGDGSQKERLKQLARQCLPDNVLFAGQIPQHQLYQYYSAADIFVFPGINESLGMVYLEAQSCGLPVVAFDTAGVPEAVRHNYTGYLTPVFDVSGFDAALRRLHNDPALRRKMGEAAKRHIRDAHDINRNYAKMETTLKRIADRRAARSVIRRNVQ